MKPIRTEDDYCRAVERIEELVLRPDAETSDELELLMILVMACEADHVPDKLMEPIADLRASIDNPGLTQADLSGLVGSSSRTAKVLRGKQELSKAMIRTLVGEWYLDANTMIGAKRAA